MPQISNVYLDVDLEEVPRPYKCICGKSYKSYPALYTHIKIKHDGIPPQGINKPGKMNIKRGRPSTKKLFFSQNINMLSQQDIFCSKLSLEQKRFKSTKNHTGQEYLNKIATLMKRFTDEKIDKIHLYGIPSIIETSIYLLSSKRQKNAYIIGAMIRKFLYKMSQLILWPQFQLLYSLTMLLVQFTIDQTKDSSIIQQGSIDLLCDHINDFLQVGVQRMIKQYEIYTVSFFEQENMLEIFQYFFQWLIHNKYTNYKISLNSDIKKVQAQAQF